ncbi:MAG: translation elongation factor Ts [Gemmataceae bacterium]|mgnify:CR=1 FL=1
MAEISAGDVKKLRERTGAPMMDCKTALAEAGGDMDKAIEIIRKRNAAIQEKKGMRETAEGRIAIFIQPQRARAAIVELRCETAPVAKNELFVALAQDVARQVAEAEPSAHSVEELLEQPFVGDSRRTVKERIGEVVGLIRENIQIARFAHLSGGYFGSYVHFDGTVGVLVQCEGTQPPSADLLKDICMHITARNPVAARREDVDAQTLEREKAIARAQAEASGKPKAIVEKIAENRLKTWFAENILVEQPFVKDPKRTVGDLLRSAGLSVRRFIRYKVGEVGG